MSRFITHFHWVKVPKRDSSVPQKHELSRQLCSCSPHAHGPKSLQSHSHRPDSHLVENFTLVQKVATTFRTLHLRASPFCGTVQVAVPWRAFVPTMITVWASKFGILTGAAVLPAGGTPGVAFQPDRHPDEAGCKEGVGNCREYFHCTAVCLWPELGGKVQYERENNWPEQRGQVLVVGERSIPPPIDL